MAARGLSDLALPPSPPDIDALEVVCPSCGVVVTAEVTGWDSDWALLWCPACRDSFWQQLIYDPWEE